MPLAPATAIPRPFPPIIYETVPAVTQEQDWSWRTTTSKMVGIASRALLLGAAGGFIAGFGAELGGAVFAKETAERLFLATSAILFCGGAFATVALTEKSKLPEGLKTMVECTGITVLTCCFLAGICAGVEVNKAVASHFAPTSFNVIPAWSNSTLRAHY